ncbi:hypothetical protein GCM10009663_21250 [Kitasatospora arboriphila]|uniref:Uncharacterized protein n=1 Tax=Kitasatospora arboriphila TaxID=258052 RepID=A0ABP4E1B5_9ACTN
MGAFLGARGESSAGATAGDVLRGVLRELRGGAAAQRPSPDSAGFQRKSRFSAKVSRPSVNRATTARMVIAA